MSTSYQLIETHSLKQANCGECPAQWREILQTYHREQCLTYLAEIEKSKNDDQ